MDLVGLDFINIAHGIENTRIYRNKGEFFCYTATIEALKPFSTTRAKNMARHLSEVLKDTWGEINLALNYRKGTYSKKKMKKLNKMLESDTEPTEDELLKWVMMLL